MMKNLNHFPTIFLNELPSVECWQREQTLGSGSFAIITLWVNTETNEKIALKQYRHNLADYNQKQMSYFKEKWLNEINLMKKLNCENVVKAFDLPKEFNAFQVTTPLLAIEFCSGGDLRKVLNKPNNCCGLTEKEVRQILKQISSAIDYLHNANIIHRDLKPENIVLQPLSSGKILYKLTDLGYAKQLSESTFANSFVGTLEYLAPELFERVEYTSAVDNWSFGLLAFEITTGRRPFLPNHSITDVLEALKKKKTTDICTELDEKGKFYFSSEIPHINHICSTLKTDLEIWFKVVLQNDPKERGGQQALRMIHQITSKRIVQVFSVNTYELFSYEINQKTTLMDIQSKIFSNTNIKPEDQYLILPNGQVPNKQFGHQIIETWYTPESWFECYNPLVIFIFDFSKQLQHQEIYKSLILPPMVENMLLDSNKKMTYDEMKLTWKSSVWVARQTVKKYSLLNETLKSCILSCINNFNNLQNENFKLIISMTELFSYVNFFRESIKMFTYNMNDMDEISTKLKSLCNFRREKVFQHLKSSKQITPKFDKENFIFEKFLKSPEVDPSLMKIYFDVQNAYDSLKSKRKKDDFTKQSPNNLMIVLLCDCFKLVESLMKKISDALFTLIKFIKTIDSFQAQRNELQKAIEQWKIKICDLKTMVWEKNLQNKKNSNDSDLAKSLHMLNLSSTFSFNNHNELGDFEKIFFDLDKEDAWWKDETFKLLDYLEFFNFLF